MEVVGDGQRSRCGLEDHQRHPLPETGLAGGHQWQTRLYARLLDRRSRRVFRRQGFKSGELLGALGRNCRVATYSVQTGDGQYSRLL